MNRFKFIVLIGAVILATGCATKVTRVEPSTKIDLSGFWNDYDAMLVSQELIKDALSHPWLERFDAIRNRKPVVIVGQVANRSMEHINTQVITKHLERELTNSGRVVFVATPAEREDIRDEREDQHKGWTDPATIKEIGKERGADYMLLGSINSVTDAVRGRAALFYQVNLELIDITTNENVWNGQKEIKKKVDRPQFSL